MLQLDIIYYPLLWSPNLLVNLLCHICHTNYLKKLIPLVYWPSHVLGSGVFPYDDLQTHKTWKQNPLAAILLFPSQILLYLNHPKAVIVQKNWPLLFHRVHFPFQFLLLLWLILLQQPVLSQDPQKIMEFFLKFFHGRLLTRSSKSCSKENEAKDDY